MRGDGRKEAVIQEIIDAMCRGMWFAGSSHLEFMDRYGVGHRTVCEWAKEASLFLRLSRGKLNEEEMRERILNGLDLNERLCLTRKRTWTRSDGSQFTTEEPELRTHVHGLELRAKLCGILDRKKGPDGETEQVQLGELVRLLEANGYEVRRKDGSDAASNTTVAAEGAVETASGDGSDDGEATSS